MQSQRVPLIIYTSLFPFSKMSESFLLPEINEASNDFELTIVPVNKHEIRRQLSNNVKLDTSLCDRSFFRNLKAFVDCFSLFSIKQICWRHVVSSLKYLYAANLVYSDLLKRTGTNRQTVFYSYWLSYAPIAFAKYKLANPSTKNVFISRAHGSDVYASLVGAYYPARELIMNTLDRIFFISAHGMNYMSNQYPTCINRFVLSRLGVPDNYCELNQEDSTIRLVSCSSIIPLKRVDLIYRTLRSFAYTHNKYHIEWTHIGDGPLYNDLKNEVEEHDHPYLVVHLKGICDNAEILDYYKTQKFHAFINLSTSEGIPVSIMEAISSGIPVIANDVGGVGEIVNSSTGVLLKPGFSQGDFDIALESILDNNDALSHSAHEFYLSHFDAKKNFREFYDDIRKLVS